MNAFPLFAARGAAVVIPPLLDAYPGAKAAWSVARKLRAAYSGPLIRAIRGGDNAQTDIGATSSGNLDTAALLAFAAGGNGNAGVIKIYDQSLAGGFDATFLAVNDGCTIVLANSLALSRVGTKGRANLYTGQTVRSSGLFGYAFPAIAANVPAWATFCAFQRSSSLTLRYNVLWNGSDNVTGAAGGVRDIMTGSTANVNVGDGVNFATGTGFTETGGILLEAYKSAGKFSCVARGSQKLAPSSGSPSTGSDTNFNRLGFSSIQWMATLSAFAEAVLYQSDQTANAAGIRANISGYYGGI